MPDDEEVEEQKPSAKKPIFIYVIVGLILVLALAGGTAYYVVTHYMGGNKVVQREPGFLMKLGDAKEGFIVNIGTANSGRYLKIGMILELKPDKKFTGKEGKNLSPDEIKIQDVVLHVLRSQRAEDFDPQKQEKLKELIKQEVNKVLGGEAVYDVYITNLLLQ
jgi:flagellar protein FliL